LKYTNKVQVAASKSSRVKFVAEFSIFSCFKSLVTTINVLSFCRKQKRKYKPKVFEKKTHKEIK